VTAAIDRRTPISDLPEYLTVREFCQYLGVNEATGYAMAQDKRLRAIRVGRLLRIPKVVLLDLPPADSWSLEIAEEKKHGQGRTR
jgi:excisionase family DNA binding protein